MPSLVELCQKHFDTDNLYNILSATADSSDKEIRRAYHRQSLKYHPDRVPEADKKEATIKFQILGKAYSVLSDSDKKAAYDENGEIDDDEKESVEDWMKFWRQQFPKLDLEDVKEFEKNYKGSEEETEQLKSIYEEYEGDMDRIMEHVLCCTMEDEPRFEKILKELIDAGSLEAFPGFVKESKTKKASRKKRFEKEKKEAEKAAKEMGLDGSEEALKAAISKNSERQGEEWSALTSNLEKKYAKPAEKAGKRKAAAKTTTGPKRTRVTRKRGGEVEKDGSGEEDELEIDSEPGTSQQDEKNKKEKPKVTKKGAQDDSGVDEDSEDKNANGMEEKSDNEGESEPQKVEKRGRGRPKAPPKRGKKVEKEEEEESQPGDDSEPDLKIAENDESDPDVAEKSGRKGRAKPKATKKTMKKEDSDKESEKPKTRGRPAAKASNDVPEPAKKPARGRAKAVKADSDDELEEAKKEEEEDDENSGSEDSLPAAKPTRGGRGAKAAPKEKKEAPARGGRGRKKVEEKDEEDVEEKAPARKGRGKEKGDVAAEKVEMKSAKIVMKRVVTRNTRGALNGDNDKEEEDEEEEDEEPKSKIKKTTAASKRGPGKKAGSSDKATEDEEKVSEEEEEDDEVPKKRNARKPAASKAEPKKRGPAPKGRAAVGASGDKKAKAVKK